MVTVTGPRPGDLSIHQLVSGFFYSDTRVGAVCWYVGLYVGIFLIRIKSETFFHVFNFISLRIKNVFNVF